MYSGYAIGFDLHLLFFLQNFDWGKNVTMFGVDMSSSVYIDKKKTYILIIGKGPTQGLDDTSLTAEAESSFDFSRSHRKFV